jgi:hypothetical protein
MKLSLKKHKVLPSAYTTHDEQYLLWQDPDNKNWYWGIKNNATGKYGKAEHQRHRTLNSCKFEVAELINEQEIEGKLWEQ